MSYRKNIAARAPKEASSMVVGRTWVEKDFLLLSSRKGSLRAGEETLDGTCLDPAGQDVWDQPRTAR